MKTLHLRLALAAALLLPFARPAGAASILGTSIDTSASITGAGSDADGPASSGAIASQVTDPNGFRVDFSGDAFARATMNASGFGAVSAEGLYASPPGRIVLTSTARWSQTVQVGPAGESLSLQLLVTPARLQIVDFANVGVGVNENIASYAIDVLVNGGSVWSSSAVLRGGDLNHMLTETGVDLGGILSTNPLTYDFDPFLGNIPIGTFAADEILTIGYAMTVLVDTPQFETGGLARIGDPFDLAGMPGAQLQLVPEPAVGALVLLALVALRSRRS